jgi:hypothetical protein
MALHPELAGRGTTLTMTFVSGSRLFVIHAGDSRCYLFRGGLAHRRGLELADLCRGDGTFRLKRVAPRPNDLDRPCWDPEFHHLRHTRPGEARRQSVHRRVHASSRHYS